MAIEQQSVILKIKEGEILMKTEAKQVNFLQKIQIPGINSKLGSFLWYFVQMVLAMEVGMIIYHRLVRPLLAPTGFSALTMEYPMFGYWMMVVSMVLGMLALMRYHKSTWRYSLEMTLAMIAPLAVLTVLVLCTLLSIHTLYDFGDYLMFLAMAVFMLLRPHEHGHGGEEMACH
jgi:hypothetical protein